MTCKKYGGTARNRDGAEAEPRPDPIGFCGKPRRISTTLSELRFRATRTEPRRNRGGTGRILQKPEGKLIFASPGLLFFKILKIKKAGSTTGRFRPLAGMRVLEFYEGAGGDPLSASTKSLTGGANVSLCS